jgi:hypothetical protein
MQFVHPEVLWALFALTIPVVVHLFSFRRHRKVRFSQTAFLREVQQESRSRNQIRHWLVLLMRLLALACIILAFAEPVLDANSSNAQDGRSTLSLYIDNSPSMELEGPSGPLLEAAKMAASGLIESHGATDRFHIFTSEFDSEDRRMRTKEEAMERLSAIQPGHAAPPIGDVLLHQKDVLSESEGGRTGAYLFTDLQASSHQLDEAASALVDSALSIRFVTQPVQPKVNVRIDSAWFDTPMRLTGRSEILHVRIEHDAFKPVDNLPLSLDINGRKTAIGSFDLKPGLPTDTTLRFRHENAGHVHAVVRTEDAPVTFDDALHLGYEVAERVKVVLVHGEKAGAAEQVALQRLFGDASLHDVMPMTASALDYDLLGTGDLVVLQGIQSPSSGLINALLRDVNAGRSLFLIPPAESLGPGWEELLVGLGAGPTGSWLTIESPARLGKLHHEHPLFSGVFSRAPNRVDLPSARGWHNRQKPGRRERNLLSFSDGRPFVTAGTHGQGRFYISAAPFSSEWTNLAQHALLVPMALRMAESATSSGLHMEVSGTDSNVLLSAEDAQASDRYELKPTSNLDQSILLSAQAVPGGLQVNLPLRDIMPGGYDIVRAKETPLGTDSLTILMALGVNPAKAESDLQILSPEIWEQSLITAGWKRSEVISSDAQDLVAAVQTLDSGQPTWIMLIALALLFLLIEMMLLKRKSAKPSVSLAQ